NAPFERHRHKGLNLWRLREWAGIWSCVYLGVVGNFKNDMKSWHVIVLMIVAGISYSLRDFAKMTYLGFKSEQVITRHLEEKYPDYKPGIFWTLQSRDLGKANPPYFIQHIYSEGNDYYKFSIFNLDDELNITSEEEAKMIQFAESIENMDDANRQLAVSIQVMFAQENISKGKPYEGIVMLQELLEVDRTSAEAHTLLANTLERLKE